MALLNAEAAILVAIIEADSSAQQAVQPNQEAAVLTHKAELDCGTVPPSRLAMKVAGSGTCSCTRQSLSAQSYRRCS